MKGAFQVRSVLRSSPWHVCLVLQFLGVLLISPEVDSGLSYPLMSAMTRSSSAMDVASSLSRRSLCTRTEVKITMYVRDCGFVTLRTHGCRGHCRSMAFPEWDTFTTAMKTIQYCGCCKPSTMETIAGMMVNCQGKDRYVRLNMKAARECHCRPCSDGDPGLTQPYDY